MVTGDTVANRFVVDLDSAEASARRLVGGKAVGLRLLRAAGLPCPPGVAVTTAAHRHFLRHAVGARSLGPLEQAALVDTEVRRALHRAHARHRLPPALADPLRRAVDRLSAPHGLAVRSSAVREDGRRLAFAGLHDSVLGVAAGDVERAVLDCWASLWSPVASAYRQDVLPQTPSAGVAEAMAVVVQPLLPALAAAIVFTNDPVKDPSLVRVEAVRGAGAPLVAGDADPDVFLLDRVTLGVVERLPAALARSRVDGVGGPAVDERLARRLADSCLRAERAFGVPLDVEAVLVDSADGEPYWALVQARPITATGAAGAHP